MCKNNIFYRFETRELRCLRKSTTTDEIMLDTLCQKMISYGLPWDI